MQHRNEKVNVPISSLIDVVFLLIMFFIVTSAISETNGIPVNLTKAENMKLNVNLNNCINISLQEDGSVYLDGVAVNTDTDNLINILRACVNERGNSLKAVIKADKNCAHKNVDKVFQTIKESGIRLISLTAEVE